MSVYPITILPVMVITATLCFMALSTLFSNVGNPSDKIHPTKRQCFTTVYILFGVLSVSAYLIVEQTLGWKPDWWPRVFESRRNQARPCALLIHRCSSFPCLFTACLLQRCLAPLDILDAIEVNAPLRHCSTDRPTWWTLPPSIHLS